MKRIVWIAATILIMLGILGYGLHTLNHIDEVNQRRREKEAGEQMASKIAMTTATTSVWDRLRSTTTVPEGYNPDEENPDGEYPDEENPDAAPDDPFAESSPEDDWLSTAPAPEEENPFPEVVPEAPEQTVTTGFVIYMN